jgi:2-iminobutanoate/2-iminopropanoate deaminase
MNFTFSRRAFAARLASVLPMFGIPSAAILSESGFAQTSAAQNASGIRKLNDDGSPASEKEVITPIVEHKGLLYISGIGAHDSRDSKEWTIESHTTTVMDKIKKAVEAGGGSMDTLLQANVYLVNIDHWDGMHKVFATYFPHGGPARTTVAVAALPGNSLVEINCIAAMTSK